MARTRIQKKIFAGRPVSAAPGVTHLALGHNADDLVQTFFMNLSRNGRVDGMSMNESFFGGGLQLIRPLLLVEKKFILKAAKQWELPIWANACPSAGNTARSSMGETLEHLYRVSKDSRRCIFNGLTRWQLEKNSTAAALGDEQPLPDAEARDGVAD